MPERAHARRGQVQQGGGTKAAGADAEHFGVLEPLLPGHPDVRDDQVARVAADFVHGQLSSRFDQRWKRQGNSPETAGPGSVPIPGSSLQPSPGQAHSRPGAGTVSHDYARIRAGGRRHRKCHWRPVQLKSAARSPRMAPPPRTVSRPAFRRRFPGGPMPTPPSQPPRGRPGPGTGPAAGARCPRVPGPPLPDPDAVRLCPVPDSAPPYDDELLPRHGPARRPDQPQPPPGAPAARPTQAADQPAVRAGRGQPGRVRAREQASPASSPAGDDGRSARPALRRGRRQLAGPVRAGAGRDAGRVPATPADDDLDHRAGPGPDPAAGPDARGRPAAPATPGGGVPARVRRDRDDRGGQLRAPGPRPGRPAGAHPASPAPCPVTSPAGPAGCAPTWRPRSRPRQAGRGRPAGRPPRGQATQPSARLRGSPWQRLYLRPDPQGHRSLRPTRLN